jgi:hypothetical protein
MNELKKAYICAFEIRGLLRQMAEDCAQIIINDRTRSRTPEEQTLIDKAFQISQLLIFKD